MRIRHDLLGILGVALVLLKVTNLITISWWLVLLPFYLGFVITFIIMVLALVITILAGL